MMSWRSLSLYGTPDNSREQDHFYNDPKKNTRTDFIGVVLSWKQTSALQCWSKMKC